MKLRGIPLSERLETAGVSVAKKQRHKYRAVAVVDSATVKEVAAILRELADDIENGISATAGGGLTSSEWMAFGIKE